MFNVKILNDAVLQLSDEGKAEIQKMVDIFTDYKAEVERLEEIAAGFEQLSKNLQRDKENLEFTAKRQAERIEKLSANLLNLSRTRIEEILGQHLDKLDGLTVTQSLVNALNEIYEPVIPFQTTSVIKPKEEFTNSHEL